MKNITLFATLLLSVSAFAQNGLLKNIKDIAMKGSIDGDRVQIIYPIGELADDVSDSFQDLDAKEQIVELLKQFYTKGNDYKDNYGDLNDYHDYLQGGVEGSKDGIKIMKRNYKKIITAPWKSIKKAPKAVKMRFQDAKDSFYNSENTLAGVVKYTAYATVGITSGLYYVVIEAPAKAVFRTISTAYGAIQTALAVPVMLAANTAVIAWRAIALTVETGLRLTGAILRGTYSVLSVTFGILVTTTATVGIKLAKGVKAIFRLPKHIKHTVITKAKTDKHFNDMELVIKELKTNVEMSKYLSQLELAKANVEKYKSTIVFKTNAIKEALIVKIKTVNTKLIKEFFLSKKLFKNLKNELDLKKKELKPLLKKELLAL